MLEITVIYIACYYHFILADIAKEAKNIKNTRNQILRIEKEVAHINKLICERKELQEYLKQAAELLKNDFHQAMKVNTKISFLWIFIHLKN